MKSIYRGVILSAVGAMLCAGLVFTADRGGRSDKADRVSQRETLSGVHHRPSHPVQIQEVTRERLLELLNTPGREGVSMAGSTKVQLLVGHAEGLFEKGQPDAAVDALIRATSIELPSSPGNNALQAQANLMLGRHYAELQGGAVRAGLHLQQAARFLADDDVRDEVIREASSLLQSVGRNQQASIDPVHAQFIGGNSQVNTLDPGLPDSGIACDTSTPIVEGVEAGLAINNIPFVQVEHIWRSFSVVAPAGFPGERVRLNTQNAADPFQDDTNIAVYNNCNADGTVGTVPGVPGATDTLIAFDEDSGDGFLSDLEACLSPGDYFVEVGGFNDTAAVPGFDLNFERLGGCFPLGPDAFEPDPFPGAEIGCTEFSGGLAAEDEENEDEEDEPDGESEGDTEDEGDKDKDKGKGGQTVCLVLQTQCRTIFPAGDDDNAFFNVGDTARRVTIETRASEACGNAAGEPDPDTVIGVFDLQGFLLALNDDKGGGSFGSQLEFCAPANTDIAVQVIAFSDTAEFFYELSVDATIACDAEVEPNGTCETATDLGDLAPGCPVRTGGFHSGLLDLTDPNNPVFTPDQDWYRVNVTDTCDYTFRIESFGDDGDLRADTEIELYSGPCPGTSIDFNDDISGTVWTSEVTGQTTGGGTTLAPGEYFVRTSNSAQFAPARNYPYDLVAQCAPVAGAEVEPNDDPSSANAIDPTNCTPTDASISPAGDRDYFGFTTTGDRQIACGTSGPLGDTTIQILEVSGVTPVFVSCDDDSGPGLFSLDNCCLPPGSYVVGVKDFGAIEDEIPAYQISCEDLGPCSADPDPALASCTGTDPFGQCPF